LQYEGLSPGASAAMSAMIAGKRRPVQLEAREVLLRDPDHRGLEAWVWRLVLEGRSRCC
jgi:hypothetical protein